MNGGPQRVRRAVRGQALDRGHVLPYWAMARARQETALAV